MIGERFELGEDELAILADGGQAAEVSDLSEPENRFETESKLLEVYSRTETPSGTPLLFETYFRYSGVTDVGRQLWAQFAPITIGALIVLELVQIPLAWSMARRLQASQLAHERLLRHALDASDAERRRIAGDLHDGVVQELTGVSLTLAAQAAASRSRRSRRSTRRQRSGRASSRCDRCSSRSTRRTSRRRACRRRSATSSTGSTARGIETRLVDELGATDRPEAAALLYRAAQEALRNVVSHSAATEVRVRSTSHAGVGPAGGRRQRPRLLDRHVGRAAADGHVGLRSLAGLVADLGG